jgi:glycosyltransferase involved in cell wall biosynthesis
LEINFSIIVPVYNRPKEIEELLKSITQQNFTDDFEVLIIEDGSTKPSTVIVEKFKDKINLNYFFKENSGAGLSRNFGMQKAIGNYFIILDSDVLLHENYLKEVKKGLKENFTDAFGGPDKAHHSFTALQKAINYSMTSVLTTGGIRGNKKTASTFQPRSFNMGLSKKAFEITKGFSDQKIGEDIDLTFRLWQNNFKTQLLDKAFVYHKRRTSLSQFFKQTFAFGSQRPKLNKKYPKTSKLTYWFPTVFSIGSIFSVIGLYTGFPLLILPFFFYLAAIFLDSFGKNLNLYVAFLSIITSIVQFFGYGFGFLKSILRLN